MTNDVQPEITVKSNARSQKILSVLASVSSELKPFLFGPAAFAIDAIIRQNEGQPVEQILASKSFDLIIAKISSSSKAMAKTNFAIGTLVNSYDLYHDLRQQDYDNDIAIVSSFIGGSVTTFGQALGAAYVHTALGLIGLSPLAPPASPAMAFGSAAAFSAGTASFLLAPQVGSDAAVFASKFLTSVREKHKNPDMADTIPEFILSDASQVELEAMGRYLRTTGGKLPGLKVHRQEFLMRAEEIARTMPEANTDLVFGHVIKQHPEMFSGLSEPQSQALFAIHYADIKADSMNEKEVDIQNASLGIEDVPPDLLGKELYELVDESCLDLLLLSETLPKSELSSEMFHDLPEPVQEKISDSIVAKIINDVSDNVIEVVHVATDVMSVVNSEKPLTHDDELFKRLPNGAAFVGGTGYALLQALRVFAPEKALKASGTITGVKNVFDNSVGIVDGTRELLKAGKDITSIGKSLFSAVLPLAVGNVFGSVAGLLGAIDGLAGFLGKKSSGDTTQIAMYRLLQSFVKRFDDLEDLVKVEVRAVGLQLHFTNYNVMQGFFVMNANRANDHVAILQAISEFRGEVQLLDAGRLAGMQRDMRLLTDYAQADLEGYREWATTLKAIRSDVALAKNSGSHKRITYDVLEHHVNALFTALRNAVLYSQYKNGIERVVSPSNSETTFRNLRERLIVPSFIATHDFSTQNYYFQTQANINVLADYLQHYFSENAEVSALSQHQLELVSPVLLLDAADALMQLIDCYQSDKLNPPIREHYLFSQPGSSLEATSSQHSLKSIADIANNVMSLIGVMSNETILRSLVSDYSDSVQVFSNVLVEMVTEIQLQDFERRREAMTGDNSPLSVIRKTLIHQENTAGTATGRIKIFIGDDWFKLKEEHDVATQFEIKDNPANRNTYTSSHPLLAGDSPLNHFRGIQTLRQAVDTKARLVKTTTSDDNLIAQPLAPVLRGIVNGHDFYLPVPKQVLRELPEWLLEFERQMLGTITFNYEWVQASGVLEISVGFLSLQSQTATTSVDNIISFSYLGLCAEQYLLEGHAEYVLWSHVVGSHLPKNRDLTWVQIFSAKGQGRCRRSGKYKCHLVKRVQDTPELVAAQRLDDFPSEQITITSDNLESCKETLDKYRRKLLRSQIKTLRSTLSMPHIADLKHVDVPLINEHRAHLSTVITALNKVSAISNIVRTIYALTLGGQSNTQSFLAELERAMPDATTLTNNLNDESLLSPRQIEMQLKALCSSVRLIPQLAQQLTQHDNDTAIGEVFFEIKDIISQIESVLESTKSFLPTSYSGPHESYFPQKDADIQTIQDLRVLEILMRKGLDIGSHINPIQYASVMRKMRRVEPETQRLIAAGETEAAVQRSSDTELYQKVSEQFLERLDNIILSPSDVMILQAIGVNLGYLPYVIDDGQSSASQHNVQYSKAPSLTPDFLQYVYQAFFTKSASDDWLHNNLSFIKLLVGYTLLNSLSPAWVWVNRCIDMMNLRLDSRAVGDPKEITSEQYTSIDTRTGHPIYNYRQTVDGEEVGFAQLYGQDRLCVFPKVGHNVLNARGSLANYVESQYQHELVPLCQNLPYTPTLLQRITEQGLSGFASGLQWGVAHKASTYAVSHDLLNVNNQAYATEALGWFAHAVIMYGLLAYDGADDSVLQTVVIATITAAVMSMLLKSACLASEKIGGQFDTYGASSNHSSVRALSSAAGRFFRGTSRVARFSPLLVSMGNTGVVPGIVKLAIAAVTQSIVATPEVVPNSARFFIAQAKKLTVGTDRQSRLQKAM